MTKKYKFLILGLAASAMLAGCSGSKDSADTTAEKSPQTETAAGPAEDGDDFVDSNELTDPELAEQETEPETIAPITPSDYLIQNASKYVSLGSYDGLEINQYTYDITDEMIQERIEEELQNAGTEEDVDTAAADGDTVYLTLESSIKDDPESALTEDTFFTIGEAEYGESFDSEITGLKTGDTKEFSIAFGDDTWMEQWVGKTVDFKVSVTGVTRLTIPEYDDQFLADYTDYDTRENYEATLRIMLEEEYTDISYSDAVDALFTAAVDATKFDGYPEELYNSCREEELSFYLMFAGEDGASEEDVLAAFGMTADDLHAATLASVNRRLFISAYCEANKIEVSSDEYMKYIEENAFYYGASSAAEFEQSYTREVIVSSLYEAKVADALYQKAKITEIPYAEEEFFDDADFALEEESAGDEDMEIDTIDTAEK